MRTFEVRPGHVPYLPGLTLPGAVVTRFLALVQVTGDADAAQRLMSGIVIFHDVTGFLPRTARRTPSDYAGTLRSQLDALGDSRLVVTELLCDGDHVFVRWRRHGRHRGPINGHPPTGLPLTEMGSTTFRVAEGRIVEVWLQDDRAGLAAQLERNRTVAQVAMEQLSPLTAA
ncbi:ester cyclase [Nocardioides antri]|uniref:Ester cyclase n=1 Tax=Nocardioides antri TaxID=2607659 RepID=A0A5B1LV06_9ACTN|nr:ester cyclase [Nocardioides antri]KAA1424234.1 ester cyclase [Nocardioides antri]